MTYKSTKAQYSGSNSNILIKIFVADRVGPDAVYEILKWL